MAFIFLLLFCRVNSDSTMPGSGFRATSDALAVVLFFAVAYSFGSLEQADAPCVEQRSNKTVTAITFPCAYGHDATVCPEKLLDMK